jgi:hypothetical protein
MSPQEAGCDQDPLRKHLDVKMSGKEKLEKELDVVEGEVRCREIPKLPGNNTVVTRSSSLTSGG